MHVYKIVLLGDKDHGKSTLIGNMLILTNSVSGERIKEAKRMSKELGREFEPGFILDSFSEEREEAMTIDTTRMQLAYKKAGFEFIDVPGHEELITNMLTGASNANTAVLIVSAKKGEGISMQTKRHLLLAMMLGINGVVVAVNKMDLADYSKDAFDKIKNGITALIDNAEKSLGKVKFEFVPISAYKGENLINHSSNMKWYKGKPLAEVLRGYAINKRKEKDEGLRVVVQGRMPDGTLACKVLAGALSKGAEVISMPGSIKCVVNKIVKAGKPVLRAYPGSSPALELSNANGIDRGSIISSPDDTPNVGKKIDALVFFSEVPKNASIRLNGVETRCDIGILKELDITAGTLKDGEARPLGIFKAEISCDKAVVFEKQSKASELGRFTIYDGGKFAGLGIVI
ncbi:MAG: GTP-binding protein [Candidatus Micrarchaeaceae archaeon]